MSSSFVRVVVRERVALLPKCLDRVQHHVLEYLNARVLKYSESLHGVVVAYSSVRILQSTTALVAEDPHIRFDVEATVTVFRPVVGSVLKGQLSKISMDVAACLVYKCFNASIVRPTDAGESWPGKDIGEMISFTVTGIQQAHGVMSIKGEMR
eukprot:scpid81822/ scgid15987/ DNA-directed RNA polymerase I subunit RPA43; Twist neighbor protein